MCCLPSLPSKTHALRYRFRHGFWLRSVAALRRFVSASASTVAPPYIRHLPGASSLIDLVAAASLWLFNLCQRPQPRRVLRCRFIPSLRGAAVPVAGGGACLPNCKAGRDGQPSFSLASLALPFRSYRLPRQKNSSNVNEHVLNE